jgi:hypothetical protein
MKPTMDYAFRDAETGVVSIFDVPMAELDEFKAANPNLIQELCTPMIVSGVPRKPDNGFRDVLREIKKKHSRGISQSTVNTF